MADSITEPPIEDPAADPGASGTGRPDVPRLGVQLAVFTIARTMLNIGRRMVYVFIPQFADGLRVSETRIQDLVAMSNALGLAAPLFGSVADARGRKIAMLVGMMSFTAAMLLVLIWPTLTALFIALLLAAVGKLVFDPAMQAYIGDNVPYTRRGFAIGITEFSWSGAFLLGMPLIAWFIARTDRWWGAFPALAALGLLFTLGIWYFIPRDDDGGDSQRPSLMDGLRLVIRHPVALAGLSIGFLISGGNEIIFIVFSPWLEREFDFDLSGLGTAAFVIGAAELASEGLVTRFVDRLGKRRALAIGISATAVASLLLPAFGFSSVGALVGLFVFFVAFEFALVSSIPLMTELVPAARATLMAANAAVAYGGRAVGAFVGSRLFDDDILINGIACAAANLVALGIVIFFIQQD